MISGGDLCPSTSRICATERRGGRDDELFAGGGRRPLSGAEFCRNAVSEFNIAGLIKRRWLTAEMQRLFISCLVSLCQRYALQRGGDGYIMPVLGDETFAGDEKLFDWEKCRGHSARRRCDCKSLDWFRSGSWGKDNRSTTKISWKF